MKTARARAATTLWRVPRWLLHVEPPLTAWLDESLFDYLNRLPAGAIVLNLGSGAQRFDARVRRHIKMINLDVEPWSSVQVVGDAHNLPVREGAVDAVFTNAVLEHVPRPWCVAEEIARVVRTGGHVFANVPFLNVIHDEADYYRFTDKALRVLFHGFTEVAAGVSAGPSSFAGPFVVEYALCALPSWRARRIFRRPLQLLMWPLKWLDFALPGRDHMRITADAFYFVGSKRD